VAELVIKTRQEIVNDYLRDLRLRMPGVDTAPGSQAFIDASAYADTALAQYTNATTILDATSDSTAEGARLDARLVSAGTGRLDARKGTGAVIFEGVAAGAHIFPGDVLQHAETQTRFEVLRDDTYLPSEQIIIRALVGGTASNLPAGAELTWVVPRAGSAPSARVAPDVAGEGITGGAEAEGDGQARSRLVGARANPGAFGSPSHLCRLIERGDPETGAHHGVAVERAFVYPLLPAGTGSTTATFLMRGKGVRRLPSAAEITAVSDFIAARTHASDGIAVVATLQDPVTYAPVFGVRWAPGVIGWANTQPFPFGAAVRVASAPAPSASGCTLETVSGSYVGVAAPFVGADVAFYDNAADPERRKQRRRRIGGVTGAGPWAVTFTALGIADYAYAPVAGAGVSPWSDNLGVLTGAILEQTDALTPGEQLTSPGGAYYRFLRFPPQTLRDTVQLDAAGIQALGATGLLSRFVDATPATPPTTGTPGINSYVLIPSSVAFFAVLPCPLPTRSTLFRRRARRLPTSVAHNSSTTRCAPHRTPR
jgi:uncharacterized phage protein gp47/JayE